MSEFAIGIGRFGARSMGLKLLLVCALALSMAVPAVCVFALFADRTHRAQQVTADVGERAGGPQTFLGPVLAVPYRTPPAAAGQAGQTGEYIIFPERGSGLADLAAEVRRRSIFPVPVYRAALDFRADFDLSGSPSAAPPGAVLDWSGAEFLVGASDLRGALSDMTLTANGKTLVLSPTDIDAGAPGDAGPAAKLAGAPAAGLVRPGSKLQVEARLNFSGAERLAVLPFARTTTFEARSGWASPSFDGGFLPVKQSVTGRGFVADWSAPFVARGAPGEGTKDVLGRLQGSAFGVTLANPGDPYQAVGRSLKYALLFVGLVFLAYFVFESTTGRRVHPAQYVLVGLAQMIFYLLLLSIAERIGFDAGFAIAAAATVGLISAYAGWVFESRRQGLIALGAFGLLYGLIYVLMRLEDLALLVGAVSSFAAIAVVMYVTRRLDWYGAPREAA